MLAVDSFAAALQRVLVAVLLLPALPVTLPPIPTAPPHVSPQLHQAAWTRW